MGDANEHSELYDEWIANVDKAISESTSPSPKGRGL